MANYSKAGIPLDCMWLDIEYMGNRFRTLTFDERKCCAKRRVLVLLGLYGAVESLVPVQQQVWSSQ